MNNELDLDALRGQWHALDDRLDASLELDVAALRRTLSDRMRSAFRRHSRWLSASLIFDAAALTALLVFAFAYGGDLPYLLSAIALLLGLSVQVATDVNEWRVLRRLDFDAPVVKVRTCLAGLRSRRLRATGMILLLAVALWTPLVLVAFRGVFGIDLYRSLPWSVLAINFALGVAIIPLGFWLGRTIERRFRDSSAYTQFIDDAAGHSWNAATGSWNAYVDLRDELDTGTVSQILVTQSRRLEQGNRIAIPLHRLKRAQKFGIALAIVPIALLATFNVTHGGMPLLIASGVLLHLVCVAVMVANIAHLGALARLDLAATPSQLAENLEWMANQRERFARGLLTITPLLAIPLTLVIGKGIFGIDLTTRMPWPVGIAVGIIAMLVAWWLARRSRRDPEHFARRVVNVLCVDTRRHTHAVIAALLAPRSASD